MTIKILSRLNAVVLMFNNGKDSVYFVLFITWFIFHYKIANVKNTH